jgi:hypothetical protein
LANRAPVWRFGTAFALVVMATPASAQVHVDVGVVASPVGARVDVGSPRVYAVDPYYEPVHGPDNRYRRRDRGWERSKRQREYHKDMREARREYEKDRRKAEREYWKDRREAEREHWKDVREAQREYEKDLREARRDRRW